MKDGGSWWTMSDRWLLVLVELLLLLLKVVVVVGDRLVWKLANKGRNEDSIETLLGFCVLTLLFGSCWLRKCENQHRFGFGFLVVDVC